MAQPNQLEKKAAFLAQVPLIRGLDIKLVTILADIMQVHKVPPGQYLCRTGGPGDACYIVGHGQIDILAEEGEEERVLATLGPGHAVGEISLLDGKPRSASVRAKTECVIFALKRDDFDQLLNGGNPAGMKLLDNMVQELAQRVRIVDNRYIDIFSKPGDTIAELNQRREQLRELQAAVVGAPQSDDDLMKMIGYTGHLAPSSK
jgi:CRP-like cAMP-binding protein